MPSAYQWSMVIIYKNRTIIAIMTSLPIILALVLLLNGCGNTRQTVAVELTIHIDIAALAEVTDQSLVDKYRSDLQAYEQASWFESLFMDEPHPPPTIAAPSPRTMLALCSDGVVLDAKPLPAIGHYDVVLKGTGFDPVLCFTSGSNRIRLAISVFSNSHYSL
jgi:hypothetical protein